MKTDEVQAIISEVVDKMGFEIDSIETEDREENLSYFNILPTGDASRLIGHRGDVLWALQMVIKNILKSRDLIEEGESIKIDVDSYRKKQEDNVLQRAESYAERVMESGRPAVLPPMSPFFRRIVHVHVANKFPRLKTSSQGMGNDRSVKIFMDGAADETDPNADIYEDLEI